MEARLQESFFECREHREEANAILSMKSACVPADGSSIVATIRS
jgi:hypothetical protein